MSESNESKPKVNRFMGQPRVLQTSIALEDLYRDLQNNEMDKVRKNVYMRVVCEIVHENKDTFMSAVVNFILSQLKKQDMVKTAIKRAADGQPLIKQHREHLAKFILALAKVLGKLYKGKT